MKLESYEIPFLQASSLRINEALLICAINDYVPFTDSTVHDRLMTLKVSRSLKSLATDPLLRERLGVDISFSLPQEQLALSIADRLVPEAELAKRSVKDLVQYRRRNETQLLKFREKLAELASDIGSVEPGPEYYAQLSRIVASRVVPEISKARDELLSKYEEAFGTLTIRSAQVTGATLAVTIFGGLGIWEILGACALAEVGMLTVKGVEELLLAWTAHRTWRRNGFSYLTNL
jgi:hypothetical protein